MEHEGNVDTNCSCRAWNASKKFENKTGTIEKQRKTIENRKDATREPEVQASHYTLIMTFS